MRLSRHSLVLALLAGTACVGNSACSSDPEAPSPSSPEDREANLQSKLQTDTGVAWKVLVDRRSDEVRFLAPLAPSAKAAVGGSPEEKARAFFDTYAADLGATEHEQLSVTSETTDTFGHASVRFDHTLAGTALPIFDASSVAEFTADGALLHIQPGFRRDLANVAHAADVPQAAAARTALDHARTACALGADDEIEQKAITLGVSAEVEAPAALAWAVDFRTSLGACVAPRVFVDAKTGSVIRQREMAAFLDDSEGGSRFHMLSEASDRKKINVTQSFDIFGKKWVMATEGPSPKVKTLNAGSLNINLPVETRTLGAWEVGSPFRGAAVDGHYYAGKALEYFKVTHHRNGLDGKGSDVAVVVHDPEKADGGRNAHYDHALLFFNDDELHVGDGGAGLLPFSAAFDIMAHELAHGVTRHTSNLLYEGESGALSEAFSDVMGASAEHWLPETRSAANNVLIGERMDIGGRGVRDMQHPSASGYEDVDHYKLRAPCRGPNRGNDFCGVHSNSGIANRAFTLMTLGGVHEGSRVAVAKGIGWETASKLWYNSFTKLLPKANFPMAAYAQLALAFTQGPDVHRAVACAWFAVGVLDAVDLRVRFLECTGSNAASAPPPSSVAPPPGPAKPGAPAGCNGRTSGYVCSDATPGFANPCNASASTVYCADTASRCKKASAADATATVDADGALVCE